MMMSFSFIELLLIILTGGGGLTNDLVSLIPTEDYFQSRKLTIDKETMLKLAATGPKAPEAQIRQLLAIRWLGENPEALKGTNARNLLEDIANGKRLNDPHGFAKLYAQRAIARLDKKPIPVLFRAKDEKVSQGLSVFPASFDVAVAMDFRSTEKVEKESPFPIRELMKAIAKRIPAREKQVVYDMVDRLGNIRVDQAAFGFEWADNKLQQGEPEPGSMIGRARGAWTKEWLIKALNPGVAQFKETKDTKGHVIARTESPIFALAMIDSSEFFIAGNPQWQGKHATIIDEMLTVRAGKKQSFLEGPLDKTIRQAPVGSHLVGAGEVPESLKKLMTQGGLPFAPRTILVHGSRAKELQLHAVGQFKDEVEAKGFSQALNLLKKQGLEQLKNPPDHLKLIPEQIRKAMQQVLEKIKMEARGAKAEVTVPISQQTVKLLLSMFLGVVDR